MGDKPLPHLTRRTVLIGCLAYLIITASISIVRKIGGDPLIFGSFWESGRAISGGANPYLNYPLVFAPRGSLGIFETNLNSPAILPLFQVFALLPPERAAALWVAVSGALHVGCVIVLYRQLPLSRLQIAWLLLPPIVVNNFNLGQIYTLLFVLSTSLWLALRNDRATLAGIILGFLVAIKPNFALAGVTLFIAGNYRTAIIGALISTALTLMPVLLYGPQVFEQWMAAVAVDRHGELFPNEISLSGFLTRAGLHWLLALALAALVGIATLIATRRRKPSYELAAGTGLWLGIVCAPLAWTYYLVVLMPFLVSRPWSSRMTLAAILTAFPPSVGHAFMGETWPTIIFGAIYLCPVLLIGWELTRWQGKAFLPLKHAHKRDVATTEK